MLKSEGVDQPRRAWLSSPETDSEIHRIHRTLAMKLLTAVFLIIGIFSAACGATSTAGPAAPDPSPGVAAPLPGQPEETPNRLPSAPAGDESSAARSERRGAAEIDQTVEPVVDQAPAQAQPRGAANPNDTAAGAGAPVRRPLPSESKVLHVGDSFAGALGIPLGRILEERGIKSVLKHTDASYLTDWAWDGSLQKYLWRYNPDLVIVTLGANELGIADPERRIKTLGKITETIGDRPCLWVGIPLWKGRQNGLMEVIREHAAPCVYWDSNQLLDVENMPRISDGIHPTSSARRDWAETLVEWLEVHVDSTPERPWSMTP